MSDQTAHSSAGGHGAAAAHHPGIGDLVWPTLNFILFVVLLVRFLVAPVREFFRERTARLRNALESGARARREAEELRAALARDAAALPAMREQLRGDLRATAERERDNLIAQGRQAAERMRRDAELL